MARRGDDDPFDDIFREIERLMGNVMGAAQNIDFDADTDPGTHIDVHEYDDEITVIADLPGVEKEDISLECTGRALSIRAARSSSTYAERIRLPTRVDETSASATYNNGVLEVRIQRADESADIDVE